MIFNPGPEIPRPLAQQKAQVWFNMTTEQAQSNTQASTNQYYQSLSALQIRLDTKPILDDIRTFLVGSELVAQENEKGEIEYSELKTGQAKANPAGVQALMSILSATFNPQVVQGNFDPKQYEQYIYDTHVSLIKIIVINSDNWAIQDDDIDVIVDFIMNLVQPFISRLIDNKEREGYSDTIKTVESNTLQQRSGWSLFPNRGG